MAHVPAMPSEEPGRPRHPRVTDGESGAHRGWTTLPRVQGGGPPSSEHFVPQWVRRRPSDPEPPGQEVALGPLDRKWPSALPCPGAQCGLQMGE